QPEGGQALARGEARQPLPLLLLRPEEEDRRRAQRGMRGDRGRDRGVDPRQLLDRDRVGERVPAGAAVFDRDRDAEQPELRELGDELVGKGVVAVELGGDRRDPLDCKLAHGLPDELVLGREVEIQRPARCYPTVLLSCAAWPGRVYVLQRRPLRSPKIRRLLW